MACDQHVVGYLVIFRLEFAFGPLDANPCDKSRPDSDFGPFLFPTLIVVCLENLHLLIDDICFSKRAVMVPAYDIYS